MFNIGWTEFLFVVIIFFIFVKPKDIPLVLKKTFSTLNKIKDYISNISNEFNQNLYVKEFKKKNKEILEIEKELKKIKTQNIKKK